MKTLKKYIRSFINEARWGFEHMLDDASGDFEDYYDNPPDEHDIKANTPYHGINVIWLGTKGRMLKVPASEVTPREDNIFDWNKVAAVRDHILHSEDKVYFDASPAQVVVIDLDYIHETQHAAIEGRLETDYPNLDEAYSTGEEELDLFIGSEEAWADEESIDLNDVKLYMKSPEEWMQEWSIDPKDMTEDEKEDIERIQHEVKQYIEMKKWVQDAVDGGWGDLGSYSIDLRDGNHRAFGAIAAGEPYIWVYAIPDRTSKEVEQDLE